MENETVGVVLELDRETHRKLIAWAKREKRSMQRQGEVVLTALIEQEEARHNASRGRRREPQPA